MKYSVYLSDNDLDQFWIFAPTKHYLPKSSDSPLKRSCFLAHFNWTTWSLRPNLQPRNFNTFCKYFLFKIYLVNYYSFQCFESESSVINSIYLNQLVLLYICVKCLLFKWLSGQCFSTQILFKLLFLI